MGNPSKEHQKSLEVNTIMRALLPKGHEVTSNFISCYRKFRIENWKDLETPLSNNKKDSRPERYF